jgi:hypothetical protein
MSECIEDKAADERADDADDDVTDDTARPFTRHDILRQEARYQADENPTENTHFAVPPMIAAGAGPACIAQVSPPYYESKPADV